MTSSLVLSNNFIKKSLEDNIPVTPMKLQKLLYLLYARYLYKFNEVLFADRFEKWQYGPVLSNVYHEFKYFGAKPISQFYSDSGGTVLIADDSMPNFASCLNEVWNTFGQVPASTLSAFTHRNGSAWSKVNPPEFLRDEDIKEDGKNFFE